MTGKMPIHVARRTILALPGVWALGGFAVRAQIANLGYRDQDLYVSGSCLFPYGQLIEIFGVIVVN